MLNRNRFEQALWIQAGAVNGQAISNALHTAYREARADTQSTTEMNRCPAVQLMLHQLCHLAAIPTHSENDRWWDWDRATKACIERCQNWQALVTLRLEEDVRLFVCDYPPDALKPA